MDGPLEEGLFEVKRMVPSDSKKEKDLALWIDSFNEAFENETERMWRAGFIDGRKHPE